MSNARDKANIPALNFSSTGIDDNATSTAITIDSAESLGLGTTSPFNSRPGSFTISNEVPTIYMEDTNSSGSGVGQILYSNGDLAYSTGTRNGTGTSNSTEHFRIKNDGKIGIGTGSPGVTLDVNSSTQTTLLHLNSTAGTSSAITFANTGSNDSIAISSENDDLKLRTDDGVIKFFTNENSEKMRIDSSGNVGIGTSSPSSYYANHLVVDIGSTAQSGITIVADSSNQAMLAFADGTSGDTRYRGYIDYNHSNDSLAFASAGTERMRIDSSGNVGIKNTTMASFSSMPGTDLVVGGGTTHSGITIYSGTSSGSNIGFADGASGDARNQGIIQYHHNGDYMRFFTSASEKMRIDSSGNVGIGTTSPDVKFHVVDTGSSQAAKIHSDTNNAGVLGMSVLAGLDTPSSSGDCKWVRLADGNDSGKAYIQFKSSSPNAEFAAISDERLKTNIQDTDVVGLDVINNLRLVKFDWNETATQDAGWSMHGHQKLGFVAQEVEAIAPEFISEDTNGFKIMGDSGFVPYLIKAMQEQQTKIEELEARITALETTP